ncbi:hypothetical protein [Hymenobacter elongatus]|uniref:Uncharacterized protein n=1 Tax=Hymenobacter elongatus TaxID=877208 RepID=A0A4Z0PLW2_9BACT|nr:hypothetical protein [Hymenobacter elongatus]TGE16766.1 hypothetical protein E5J99_08630 [Hymenobacter elongatus]
MSVFDGNEGTIVTVTAAAAVTHNYNECPDDSKPVFKGQFFGKNKLKDLIDDCGSEFIGIRIYNAMDANGEGGFVLVGVKADQNDLYDNIILADGPSCPPCCAPNSPLNN